MSNATLLQLNMGNRVHFGRMEQWKHFYSNKWNVNNLNKSLGFTNTFQINLFETKTY